MPKVYDCFPFDGEEILDLRLRLLWDVVDWFVIGEATITHAGQPKTLRFDPRRYAWAMPKIRYLRMDPDVFAACKDNWARENWQRIRLRDGCADAMPDDIVMVSDVDEIPAPTAVRASHPRGGIRVFEQMLFYFYGDYLCVSAPVWKGTRAVGAATLGKFSLQDIRTGDKQTGLKLLPVRNGGWHFSYVGGLDRVIEKIERTVHTEVNDPRFKNRAQIKERMARGEDIYFREASYARVTGYEAGHRLVKDWFEGRPGFLSPPEVPYAGEASSVVRRHRGIGRVGRKVNRGVRRLKEALASFRGK